MIDKAENGIPRLNRNIESINKDKELSRVFSDLEAYHGHAVTIQNQNGVKLPFRINDETLKMEVFKNNKWQEVGV
jgi:hypothetical protein